MVHHVKDLSIDQRLAIEALLGRPLHEDESIIIRPSIILKEAPTGQERVRAFRQYQMRLDEFAARVKHVSEEEIDSAISEAAEHAQRKNQ